MIFTLVVYLMSPVRFELTALRLKGGYSATELRAPNTPLLYVKKIIFQPRDLEMVNFDRFSVTDDAGI